MSESIATRKSFGKALEKLGEKYPEIVCLDADLSKSTMSCFFAEKYPERFFEMGIQEANMIGVAAGLSFYGKIPFICSFGAFLTGRFDTIRMSIGYSNANVKMIGTHCGVGIGEDGHSQMGLEDISLMRTIPGMTVLQPADDQETFEMIEWSIKHKGPVYLRLTRQNLKNYNMAFKGPGLYHCLNKGSKVLLLSTSGLLEESEKAINQIKKETGKSISLYNLSSVKPLNNDFLQNITQDHETIIVLEDHYAIGGSFGAIAEWSSQYAKKPLRVIPYCVQDIFGESGKPNELYEKHGFTSNKISECIKNYL
jgi:transketolase